MKQQPDESDESDESVSDAASVCQIMPGWRQCSKKITQVTSGHIESYRVIVTSQGGDRVAPPQGYYGTTATVRSLKSQDEDVSGEMVRNMVLNDAHESWVQGLVRGLVSNGLQDKFLQFPRPKSHRLCCFCTKDLKQDLNRVGMDQDSYQKDSKFNIVSIRINLPWRIHVYGIYILT